MFLYVLVWTFSTLSFDFLPQNIHTTPKLLNWLFTKIEAMALTCITVRNFFIFFFLICCRTHKLYDAFSQKMSIWASTVTFLSMVISKRTILYFEKIQGVLKTEFEKELQFKLWLAISKTPKDSHEVSVDGSFKALSKYSKFAFLSQTFFYWNVLENYSFLYNCSAGMGEGVGRT